MEVIRWIDPPKVRWLDGLPSGESAAAVVSGDLNAVPVAAFHTLVRAGLIGLGMYAAGLRQHAVKYSIAGALGIEVFVLLWAWYEKQQEKKA